MSETAARPTPADAERIAQAFLGEPIGLCERFTTGLRNWVYDVAALHSGRRIVVRLSHPDHRHELRSGIAWTAKLAELGIPVAPVLAFDTDAKQPFTILERLPGTDIGRMLPTMSAIEITAASRAVAEMQLRAAQLPAASGFGYAMDYDSPLHKTWHDMLRAEIADSRQLIANIGIVTTGCAAEASGLLERRAGLFASIEPFAFLDDATTKNVIVDAGHVVGLVDVDQIAFGDPLWAVALTRMSLLSAGLPTEYADLQIDAVSASSNRWERTTLYTAIHCLGFLAELGQRFNQDVPAPVDPLHQRHLEAVFSSLLDESEHGQSETPD